MNKFLITALAGLLAISAQAQSSVALGVGNPQVCLLNAEIPASTSTTVTKQVSMVGSPNMLVTVTVKGATGLSSPGTLTFTKSTDGVNFTTGGSVTFQTGGTLTTTTVGNLATDGVPFWKLTTVDNTANSSTGVISIAVQKDSTSVSSLGTTVRVGGTTYTPTYMVPLRKAATTQVALTLYPVVLSNLTKSITYVSSYDTTNIFSTISVVTNVVVGLAQSNVVVNTTWGFASTTAGVVTNINGVLILTP